MRKIAIIVTCAGGATMPFLLGELRRSRQFEVDIIGCDLNDIPAVNKSFLRSFHRVPMGSDPGYIDTLLGMARHEGVALIWPGSDEEAIALAQHRPAFSAQGVALLTSSNDCLGLITDKLAVYRQLKTHGIRTPDHAAASGYAELLAALEMFDFPRRAIAVKPSRGRGGRGVVILAGNAAPEAWIGTGNRETRHAGLQVPVALQAEQYEMPQIVMPIMQSPVYDADVLADKGRVLASVLRRRDNPAGIPFTGNVVYRADHNSEFCAQIAAALELDSLHDYDLMTDDTGQIQLLEVNPRPSGSFVATLAAGIPLADAAIAKHLGEPISLTGLQQDVWVRRIGDRLDVSPTDPNG